MVHLFEISGRKLVFDPVSGGLHAVDDLAWEIIGALAGGRALPQGSVSEAVAAVLAEIEELKANGSLFVPDRARELYVPPPFAPKSLCLMVAQECNLRCTYCFAGEGTYGGGGLMSAEVAFRAIDFLLERSGPVRAVEVDFFGGEPLLNWPVVTAVVDYATERARACHKEVSFTLTTNAVLLDTTKSRYLIEKGINVVLSLDGRKEVHDRFRCFPGGAGSYERVLANCRNFFQAWAEVPRPSYCYIRGTYTRFNLDFTRDFRHLVEEGFTAISLEPVVASPAEPYALREEDVAPAVAEYERLAEDYLAFRRSGRPVRFFHFELDPAGGPCLTKRLTGCGAGFSYVAVDVDGRLYPCHQFVGDAAFCLGDLATGRVRQEVVEAFRNAHVYNKLTCAACWARFFCGGGCHAAAHLVNGDIMKPYAIGCMLMRKRAECALYLLAQTAGTNSEE
jgi:uncharacterized protein